GVRIALALVHLIHGSRSSASLNLLKSTKIVKKSSKKGKRNWGKKGRTDQRKREQQMVEIRLARMRPQRQQNWEHRARMCCVFSKTLFQASVSLSRSPPRVN